MLLRNILYNLANNKLGSVAAAVVVVVAVVIGGLKQQLPFQST